MKIIDLSQTIKDGMEVYPGDPEVKIQQVHSLPNQGWRLRSLSFGSHTGTHVDAFAHMDEHGETIDKIPLERFCGEARITKLGEEFATQIGLVFKDGHLEPSILPKIMQAKPKFIAVGDNAHLDIELERQLLFANTLTFTDLVNLNQLPEATTFMFFGVPLKIKDGDGSPIRAFAIVT